MDSLGLGIRDWGLGIRVLALAVYAAGVVWGLIAIEARPAARLGLALVWPLGPLAFLLTITMLLAASLIAFPTFGAAVLLAAALTWWALT